MHCKSGTVDVDRSAPPLDAVTSRRCIMSCGRRPSGEPHCAGTLALLHPGRGLRPARGRYQHLPSCESVPGGEARAVPFGPGVLAPCRCAQGERGDGAGAAAGLGRGRLMVLTGCRIAEILKLKWTHVEVDAVALRFLDLKTCAEIVHLDDPAIAVPAGHPRPTTALGHHGKQAAEATAGSPIQVGPHPQRARIDGMRIWDFLHNHATRLLNTVRRIRSFSPVGTATE